MKKTAEAVSLGHPDKISDYISSYILDKMIEQDPYVKYAVEVLVKDNHIVLGGEITGNVNLDNVKTYILNALSDIGYTNEYAKHWKHFAIEPNKVTVENLIGCQSCDINKGVKQNGWGDQGVFVGYACKGKENINRELFLARKLNQAIYEKAKNGFDLGLDIKTQITLDDTKIDTAIVAVPMLKKIDLTDFIIKTLGEKPKHIIVNGTGIYTYHSSIADCGITGRKLAVDFYSTACPIGGGSPWTKDPSKADLTLNIYARKLALQYLNDNDECFVYLSSCIGKSELPSATVKTIKNGTITMQNITVEKTPSQIIEELGLQTPIYKTLCKNGLFSLLKT
ncbi:MAG: methionine adenosyltransferase domain-containing protein [Alphaproteobacteria bacterium]|nr:methionine adenosyltransferase domain-containing protein [Alphaproteobacteria bacterium]MBR4316148.1 methionine adenosyltransferase domain-containing protein [Alphaproteobacteria bacterium]